MPCTTQDLLILSIQHAARRAGGNYGMSYFSGAQGAPTPSLKQHMAVQESCRNEAAS